MNNKDVIRALGHLADLLQLTGADEFRVRSYQRAQNTVRGLSADLNDVDLDSLPGIGASLAATISEVLTTGASHLEAELRAEVPAGLLQLLEVPELGPKTARRLWQELGLDTIDAVEAAARGGQLRGLKGFGERSEAKLLANIALWRTGRERLPRAAALALAAPLLAAVQAAAGVEEACLAGSLRRGRDTTGDLDVLAAAVDSGPAIAAFCAHESVAEVVVAGETKASVRLVGGFDADLRVVPPSAWGAAQIYFTGSKAHNIALRARARAAGWTLNEYSLSDAATETPLAGRTEAEIYATLDLPWIPPELREDRGELAGPLPALIEPGDIRGDLHCHTRWSDGLMTVLEAAQRAAELGHAYLAITDHSKSLVIANGLNEERLRAQRAEIRAAQELVPSVRLLAGMEVDILPDGRLDLDDDALDELDIVIGSVHQWLQQGHDEMTARLLTAIRSGRLSILGHPTGRLLGRREPFAFDVAAVFAACVEHGVALEINSQTQRLDLDDVLSRQAVSLGAKLVISTDAHNSGELGNIPLGVLQARRGWVEAAAVLNTSASVPRFGRD